MYLVPRICMHDIYSPRGEHAVNIPIDMYSSTAPHTPHTCAGVLCTVKEYMHVVGMYMHEVGMYMHVHVCGCML